ncbi:MAG TPA: hypothetical protein VMP08_05945 [Anaerolineae bacterium]|nr:hypothetical protein [Anaerolineae bacterium]
MIPTITLSLPKDKILFTSEDMTLPWLVAGPGIRRKYGITRSVSLLNTARSLPRRDASCPFGTPHLTISRPALTWMVNRYWGEF